MPFDMGISERRVNLKTQICAYYLHVGHLHELYGRILDFYNILYTYLSVNNI